LKVADSAIQYENLACTSAHSARRGTGRSPQSLTPRRAGCEIFGRREIPTSTVFVLIRLCDKEISQWATKLRLDLAEVTMLYWALIFLIVAIVAAIFGFGGVAVASAGIAKILFFIFLVLFIVSLIFRGVRRV
jgi:uncharacterized membrane protein YtjA (UPF0391 family)